LICVASDVGGYIFGKLFKGPKLSKISPNKTYSGMIGSYFFSIICAYLYLNEYSGEIGTGLNLVFFDSDLVLLLTVFLISSVSQLGDLTVSYFKRLSKIKNTGKILPGHGGLLDRVDGIIFVIPFAYLFLNFIKL
jgi:phosphatidate cytidylyltransferase